MLESVEALAAQSRQTMCNPMDCSPQGSPVHGFLQARILEGVVIPFSRGVEHRSPTLHAGTVASKPPGKQIYPGRFPFKGAFFSL